MDLGSWICGSKQSTDGMDGDELGYMEMEMERRQICEQNLSTLTHVKLYTKRNAFLTGEAKQKGGWSCDKWWLVVGRGSRQGCAAASPAFS